MLEVAVRRRLPGFTLDVAFQVGEEIIVLFGPSGSGKSLTLQCIAGIVRPDEGRIVADGRVLFDSAAGVDVPPQARRVGYVPQSYALFPHLTVVENIAYGLRGLRGAERDARVREMMALVGLDGLERRRPHELSGGQQQRVALARALAVRPDTLLLDEPFAALDVAIRGELREELLALQRRAGVTTVVVTHDLEDAFLLGQRMAVIDQGRVLQAGPREEVFYRPRSRRVAEFVRTRNVLVAQVLDADVGALRLAWRGRVLEAERPEGRTPPPGARVHVCIRPTQIMIMRPDRPDEPRHNKFPARIVEEHVQVETYRLFLRLTDAAGAGQRAPWDDGGPETYDLEVELPGYVYFRLGLDRQKEITISVRREAVWVIPDEAPSS